MLHLAWRYRVFDDLTYCLGDEVSARRQLRFKTVLLRALRFPASLVASLILNLMSIQFSFMLSIRFAYLAHRYERLAMQVRKNTHHFC